MDEVQLMERRLISPRKASTEFPRAASSTERSISSKNPITPSFVLTTRQLVHHSDIAEANVEPRLAPVGPLFSRDWWRVPRPKGCPSQTCIHVPLCVQ